MEFKNYFMGEWVKHNDNACDALKEYDSNADYVNSPYAYMQEVAIKYSVTIVEMKEHWKCIEKTNQYRTRT